MDGRFTPSRNSTTCSASNARGRGGGATADAVFDEREQIAVLAVPQRGEGPVARPRRSRDEPRLMLACPLAAGALVQAREPLFGGAGTVA
jgi:hypothetical protein